MASPARPGEPVCLDYAATTPLRPEVLEAMEPVLTGTFGNPSGMHEIARRAKTALEDARERVAAALGCRPIEVVFTGSGTEADNLAVKGAARAGRAQGSGDHVVVSAFEHHAVLDAAESLTGEGFRSTRVRVTRDGLVDLDHLEQSLDERTVVVSVMLVNNEVGTVQPLADVARIVRERAPRAVLHTDAVQAVPWLDVSSAAAPADLVAVSAHKFGGPKGVGALVVRRGVRVEPLVDGGGQEAGLRSGTHDVAGICGLAAALDATTSSRDDDVRRLGALRDRLARGLADAVPDAVFHGAPEAKVAGNCHVGFPGVESEALLLLLDREGLCAAAGSSCQSGSMDPSHVLSAMGIDDALALASVRLSLGWPSADLDVDRAIELVPKAVEQLRASAPRARSTA